MIEEMLIRKAVDDLFARIVFTREPAGLYDPLRYMIAIGGKRLRPRLCLTAYALFKDAFTPQILEPAAGLEVFHTFTLIHDDIMDKSPMRRGCDTVWKKWNGDTAILSGDVMCIDSYRRIAAAPADVLPEVLDLFTTTAAQVCDGQQYDMEFENMPSVGMESYMHMIGLKTAVLIACSAKMGALIAGAPAPVCDALYRYGFELGLAFQVADDYLDAYGDSKVFGKPIGGDILNGKKSWLTVRAMEKGAAGLAEALAAPAGDDPSGKIAKVMALYEAVDVASDAQAEIARLHGLALSAASEAVSGEGLALLQRFADSLLGRTK
jgi:geranylgeranyl diphosphate synthase type II